MSVCLVATKLVELRSSLSSSLGLSRAYCSILENTRRLQSRFGWVSLPTGQKEKVQKDFNVKL